MSIGGDLLEATFNHPTLGSGALYGKSDEAQEADLGGYVTDDDANGVTGNGIPISKMNRKRWEYTLPALPNETIPFNTLEKLQELANSTEPAVWTFTLVTGTIVSGKGKPVGDIKIDFNTSLISGVKIAGGGKLDTIVG
jgi:hypothetical protein